MEGRFSVYAPALGMKTRRFSTDEVRQIRETYSAGKATLDTLAKKHGCSAQMIWRLVSGDKYKDAPGPLTVVHRRRTVRPRAQKAAPPKSVEIKVGSTVKLRSGGPGMTAVQVDDTTICAAWFDAAGRNHVGTFPVNAVEVVS